MNLLKVPTSVPLLLFLQPGQRSRHSNQVRGWTIRSSNTSTGNIFLFSRTLRPVLELNLLLIQWAPAALSPLAKLCYHETGHSPLSIVEFEKKWSYSSSRPICFHVADSNNFNSYCVSYPFKFYKCLFFLSSSRNFVMNSRHEILENLQNLFLVQWQ